jgi:SAM-dependent methyltransferase
MIAMYARLPGTVSQSFAEPIYGLRLQCPQCEGTLDPIEHPATGSEPLLRCSGCLFVLRCDKGIWKGLPQQREAYFTRFIGEYQTVRAAEGRGSEDPEYYLALPYRDLSGRNVSQWAMRARTFRYILRKVLLPIEAVHPAAMKVLDLGAGNGWMSYRLALGGHRPAAVDLLTNDQDGLGAALHFRKYLPALFPRFQAELEHLPFADRQFDLAIFNASFHYSEDYERTLREALRCLRPGGAVIIADTAWYRRDESGQKMLSERRQVFTAKYGFPSDGIKSLEYLTDERLAILEKRFGLRWRIHSPFYGMSWAMRPWLATLRGRREPSQFRIYVAEIRK